MNSIKAAVFKVSRRRPTTVHDTSLKIVVVISIDSTSCLSAAIKSEIMSSSTSVLLKGQVTTKSALENTCTISITGADGLELGME
jgi:hypothetical protein